MCNLIQSEITNITGPIIVFDLTNSNQMIDSTQDVVKYLKLPAISYEYCTNDFQCNIYQVYFDRFFFLFSLVAQFNLPKISFSLDQNHQVPFCI